ncbi:MAG TPA: cadherin-like beta sandwich domain-containing protein [Clostridium sp.]
MNRNLKKIIAVVLTVSAFSAFAPAANLSLITTKAYAASGDLTNIKVKTSDGSTIKTYSESDYKSKNQVDDNEMDEGETYFAKTSSDKIKISTSGVSSSYVRIFKGKSSSTKGVKTSSTIDLSSASTTTLIIRTYSEDPGTVKYSDDSFASEYTIKVKYTGSSSDSEEDENGDVYLKTLTLSDGSLSFSKNTSSYNVNVSDSVSEVKITAKPDCDTDEYDNYDVTIDGKTVDQDDKFKRSVSLIKGINKINITVEDDNDQKRTYTLNITRGETTTNNSNNNGSTTTPTVKANQWIQVNGLWQYNDSSGNPIKNNWFTDRNYGKDYYLQSNGYMATSWLNYSGSWYYLGNDGAKKTGWQSVSGTWYYLDSQGKMQTGWIKDNGKYYYLNSNGSMASNTTIGGYKLGANGAWVG